MQSYAFIHSRMEWQRMEGIENTKTFKVFFNMETCSMTWGLHIFCRLQCVHVNSEDDIPKREYMEVWIGSLKNHKEKVEWEIKVFIVGLLKTFKWPMFIGSSPKAM